MAESMVPAWFQPDVYYQNKLSGGDADALNAALLAAGYSLDAEGLYRHFVDHGNNEGVSPNPLFDTRKYLRNKTADAFGVNAPTDEQIASMAAIIAAAGMTPWEHYGIHGWREGINPSDAFDGNQYLWDKSLLDGGGLNQVIQGFHEAGFNPISHYYACGMDEGLSAKPVVLTVPAWFEWEAYYQNKLASMEDGWTPAALNKAFEDAGYSVDAQGMYSHFLDYGNDENISPNSVFDPQDYLIAKTADFLGVENPTAAQMAEVAALIDKEGMTLWDHYCRYGWVETVNPSDTFDGNQYIKAAAVHYDITVDQMIQKLKDEGINPVTHYLMYDIGWVPSDPVPTNARPVITGIPAQTTQLSVGDTINLADFTVSDADGDDLTVTLTAVNGTLGGVTDADPNTPGIQLKGSASAINAALKNLTFTATQAGNASVGISVTDGKATTTASYKLSTPTDPTDPDPIDPIDPVTNTPPVISGIPAQATQLSVGETINLADFTVSDADGDDLVVTLTVSGGTLGGVTDADPNANGIQLKGTAATINAALKNLTFTATTYGNRAVYISVTDGTDTTTATYNLFTPGSTDPTWPGPGDDDPDSEPVQLEDVALPVSSQIEVKILDVQNASEYNQPLRSNVYDTITFSYTPKDSNESMLVNLELRDEDWPLFSGENATFETLVTAIQNAISDSQLSDDITVSLGDTYTQSLTAKDATVYEAEGRVINISSTTGSLDMSGNNAAHGLFANHFDTVNSTVVVTTDSISELTLDLNFGNLYLANVTEGDSLNLATFLDGPANWGSGTEYQQNNGVTLVRYDHTEENHQFTIEELEEILPGLADVEPYAKSVVIIQNGAEHTLFYIQNDDTTGVGSIQSSSVSAVSSFLASGTTEFAQTANVDYGYGIGRSGFFVSGGDYILDSTGKFNAQKDAIALRSILEMCLVDIDDGSLYDQMLADNPYNNFRFFYTPSIVDDGTATNDKTQNIILDLSNFDSNRYTGPTATHEKLVIALKEAILRLKKGSDFSVQIGPWVWDSDTIDGKSYEAEHSHIDIISTNGRFFTYPGENQGFYTDVPSDEIDPWVHCRFYLDTLLKITSQFGNQTFLNLREGDYVDVSSIIFGGSPRWGASCATDNGVQVLHVNHDGENHIFSVTELQKIIPYTLGTVGARADSIVILRDDDAHTFFYLTNDGSVGVEANEITKLGSVTTNGLTIGNDGYLTTSPIDSSNSAPTISGVPEHIQRIPLNTEIDLADIIVADSDDDVLSVTLGVSTSGISGQQYGYFSNITDKDPSTTNIIELSGTAKDINAQLAKATFTATENGTGVVQISVSDGQDEFSTRYVFRTPFETVTPVPDSSNEQMRFISSYNINVDFQNDSNKRYRLTSDNNTLIIDAEKSGKEGYDSLQCWAGTTSNLLAYSGWTLQSTTTEFFDGPRLEDAIFDEYRNAFTDGGATLSEALNWFFNGTFNDPDPEVQLINPNSGNYLNGTDPKNYVKYYSTRGSMHEDGLPLFLEMALDLGLPIGLVVGFYDNDWNLRGIHAVTCWGYTYNETLDPSQPGYLTGLVISDSDNSKGDKINGKENPENSDDLLWVIDLQWDAAMKHGFGDDGAYCSLSYTSAGFPMAIMDVSILLPNSAQHYNEPYLLEEKFNFAPIIIRPDSIHHIVLGKEINLADFGAFGVVDYNDDYLRVTLDSTTGVIGGVTDENSAPGIQISGYADDINRELSKLTFMTTQGGESTLNITVSDGEYSNSVEYSFFSNWLYDFSIDSNTNAVLLSNYEIHDTSALSFPLSDDRIVDAEKENNGWLGPFQTTSRDAQMSWAATAANMLAFSGWWQESKGGILKTQYSIDYGNNIEDKIFDIFKDSFTKGDEVGNFVENGLTWFFNGEDQHFDNSKNHDVAKEDTGNFIDASPFDYLTTTIIDGSDYGNWIDTCSWFLPQFIATACDLGMPVGIYLDWYDEIEDFDDAAEGGHVVTCWGYTYDSSKTMNTAGYLTGLIVSDSDDNRNNSPQKAPDTLKTIDLYWSQGNGYYSDSYKQGIFSLNQYGIIKGACVLLPNSAEHDKEMYAAIDKITRPVADELVAGSVDIIGSTTGSVDFFDDVVA